MSTITNQRLNQEQKSTDETEGQKILKKQKLSDVDRSQLIVLRKSEILKALEFTRPSEPTEETIKERESQVVFAFQVFRFARALWGIEGLKDCKARDLLPYVEEWHRRAPKHISGEPFDLVWLQFACGWSKIEKPLDIYLLANALKAARKNPVANLPYTTADICDVVGLCRELQTLMGAEPFFLSTRTAGGLFGEKHTVAAQWLRMLDEDDWIVTTKKGAGYRATRFRYTGKGRTKTAEVSK